MYICKTPSYQVEHSKKLNLSTNITCNERKIIVSWHTNVLWQPRIRIWERSLTLWNKSKCVTCDFVKMSLSTYFTHVTFFNQKLNRYMLIANTNTAIKLFTRKTYLLIVNHDIYIIIHFQGRKEVKIKLYLIYKEYIW